MPDPNLITQLAEALPEGTEVPGFYFDTAMVDPCYVHPVRGPADKLFVPEPLDLAAFTYAAEGVLLDRGWTHDQDKHLGHEWCNYSDDSPATYAPSRPAAALAALRAMKEKA